MSDNSTLEASATPLEESQETLTADEAPAPEAVEAPEAAGNDAAAAETSPEPEPSKLEKAYTRTKEENRSLKAQVRDLHGQIVAYQQAELERSISDLARQHRLSFEQAELLKMANTEDERKALAAAMRPVQHPVLGHIVKDSNVPAVKTLDSIPTLARR